MTNTRRYINHLLVLSGAMRYATLAGICPCLLYGAPQQPQSLPPVHLPKGQRKETQTVHTLVTPLIEPII